MRAVGEPRSTGSLYDSNSYTVQGLLMQLGLAPHSLGIVPDRRDILGTTLQRAAGEADLIISPGGVSVGEADFVRDSLNALGELHFWRVGMKPGRPFAFGRDGAARKFGLSGFLVSFLVSFLFFVLFVL